MRYGGATSGRSGSPFRLKLTPRVLAICATIVAAVFGIAEGSMLSKAPARAMQDTPPPPPPPSPVVFQKPIAADQLAFLNSFAGRPANDLVRDGKYKKLMHTVIPDTMFHYGIDMPLSDAVEKVMQGSSAPVQIHDGRYLVVSRANGPYLRGRGFIWIDLQEGIGLGGFYFHPTNGEPTPSVTVFSRQVKDEDAMQLSQLPAAFAQDLSQWSADSSIPPVTTRYFITGSNKKILLEHSEDYCAPAAGAAAPSQADCEQMNADAADIDMNAAYYLEQTNHATNATARMIEGNEEVAWIQLRENTCRVGPDPLRCRVRMTHEHIHGIGHAPPPRAPRR